MLGFIKKTLGLEDGGAYDSKLSPAVRRMMEKRALGMETEADRLALNAISARTQAQQQSMAQSARGINPALAQKLSVEQSTDGLISMAGKMDMNRVANQGAAINQSMTVAEQDREADIQKSQRTGQVLGSLVDAGAKIAGAYMTGGTSLLAQDGIEKALTPNADGSPLGQVLEDDYDDDFLNKLARTV